MKKYIPHNRLIFVMLLTVLLVLSSCVGTVEDGKRRQENFKDPKVSSFVFIGLNKATAISHDKIEVEFLPQFVDGSGYNYYLYINENEPILLNLEDLESALAGNVKYTLKNLGINQVYKLKMIVRNEELGLESKGALEYFISTFDNRTAQFLGINDVIKVTGQTDRTVKLSWIQAEMEGIIVATSYDPLYYEITYISEAGGPANLNNPDYAGSDRITMRVPSPPTNAGPTNNPSNVTITNLDPGKKYYFQVRAVNKLYDFFASDPLITVPPVDREVNSRYMPITMDAGGTPLDFNKQGITLQNAAGVRAFDTVNMFWEEGTGTFEGYRIYIREYLGNGDPTIDDEMTPTELDVMDLANDFTVVASADAAYSYDELTAYKWYQVKIVLCKTSSCPLNNADSDYGVISDMYAIRTEPQLAPFAGIAFIGDSLSASSLDEISITYDPADLSIGYADEMELYCINPDDYSEYTKFPMQPGTNIPTGAEITGSTITNCNGIKLKQGTPIDLSGPILNITGVNTINTSSFADSRYCFALAPAINFNLEVVGLAESKWVVRCVNPEIKVPTMTQFTGAKGSCLVNQNSATINWDAPTGGVFNKYEVFWKDSSVSAGFSYGAAVAGSADYDTSSLLDSTSFTHTITDLRPGKKYYVGVLAAAYDPSGTNTIYSEANLNVVECNIPLPKATFKEWTRVLAIGPKIDGRFPPATHPYEYRDEAFVYESLNVDGIPYENNFDPIESSLDSVYYQVPPGSYNCVAPYLTCAPGAFTDPFDGIFNEDNWGASKYGIISLAWKDMDIEFLDTEFHSEQKLQVRSNRKYGYKVLRSDDNRASWNELTETSGLIQSNDYTYHLRPGSKEELPADLETGETAEMSRSEVTERMAFFTDYSIKAFNNDSDGVQRARVFWYKIVPVFEDLQLTYGDDDIFPHHMLKVVLPPPNMALVHRMMANRNLCQEMDKTIDTENGKNYSCDYNGVGARAKSFPWTVNETVIDLGGDLLVDRYELGCNITRGHNTEDPADGASMFTNDDATYGAGDYIRPNSSFNGLATSAGGTAFKGCVGGTIFDPTHSFFDPSPPVDYDPSFKKAIWGDCLGYNSISIRKTDVGTGCTWGSNFTSAFPGSGFWPISTSTATNFVCEDNKDYPTSPQVAFNSSINVEEDKGLLDAEFRRNMVTQGEFLAVHFNRGGAGGYDLPWMGPLGAGLYPTKWSSGNGGTAHKCSINLASIGSDNNSWRSRWIPISHLDVLKTGAGTYASAISKTVSEVAEEDALYDLADYKAPNIINPGIDPRGMSPRYNADMPLSRIVATNSSKMPPLTGVDLPDAQEYCNNFEVQLGVGDSSGAFTAMEPVKQKRLMRRQEFVAMAAWPETYDEDGLTSAEGECNTSGHVVDPLGLPNGIDDVWSTDLPYGGTSTGAFDMSLITGSSDIDDVDGGHTANTEKCMSRFGIQDLIGNVREMNTDTLFCDYSKDHFYWGQHTGNPYLGTGAGDVNFSVKYQQDWQRHILSSAVIEFEDETSDITDNIVWTDNTLWTRIDPNSGYCSLVDIDPLRVDSFYTDQGNFIYASGSFRELLNPDNTINTSLVQNTNTIDDVAADYLRNGDGFFLHFGPNNMAPQMKYSKSISLSGSNDDGVALGPYFNPLVGMSLSCDQLTCSQTGDNKKITTDFFKLQRTPSAGDLEVDNFPIGGSKVNTIGTSVYKYDNSSLLFNVTFDGNTDPTNFEGHHVVEKFIVKLDGTVEQVTKTYQAYWEGTQPTTVTLSGVQWDVNRGSTYKYKSGGSYSEATAGRYSLYLDPREHNQNIATDGFRCVVRVND